MTNQYGFRLSQLIDIVYRAGDLIRDVHFIDEIKEKEGPENFVTKYDSAVQAFLIRELSSAMPNACFLAEEDGMTNTDISNGFAFIIDPIDGTTNFICDFHCSGICVGLSYCGEMIMGAVYNPFREEMFYAEKGKGAFLNGRKLRIDDKSTLEGVIDIGQSAPYPSLRNFEFDIAKVLSYHTMDLREVGAASIAICYVACGRVVMYTSPKLYAWDYAAASIIVEEAGGVVAGFDGKALNLRSNVTFLATTKTGLIEFLSLTEETRNTYRNLNIPVVNF